MANTYESSKARTLTHFLKRIDKCDDPEVLREEARQLLRNLGSEDIATAEQNLIDDGYSAHTVQLLSAAFMLMGMPQEQSEILRTSLPANHILRVVMVEHELIRCFIADLNDIVNAIGSLNYLSNVNSEFRRVAHIIEHLNAMEEHIEREEDVIFPYLKKHGRISLCRAMQGDHIKIGAEIDGLVGLIISFNKIGLEEFKATLVAITRDFCPIMLEHLSQEDSILYPIAIKIIDDVEVWEQIKAVCDEIGYCGVHL